jgi:hypothetical protein
MGELRRIASQGIPDGAGIRSTVWKVINLYFFFFLKKFGVVERIRKKLEILVFFF